MKTLVLDSNALWARAWFMAESTHQNPKALAIKMVLNLIDPSPSGKIKEVFTHAVWTWDGKAKNDKGRTAKPPEYGLGALDMKVALGHLLGGMIAYHPEMESDDLIAQAVEGPGEFVIATSDKDILQLMSSKVRVWDLGKDMFWTSEAVCQRWSVSHPSELAVALAVIGDSSDNIAGVRGAGPKKWEKLVQGCRGKDLATLVTHVESQLSEEARAQFHEALGLTLLGQVQADFEIIPQPIKFVQLGELEAYGLREATGKYATVSINSGGVNSCGLDEVDWSPSRTRHNTSDVEFQR